MADRLRIPEGKGGTLHVWRRLGSYLRPWWPRLLAAFGLTVLVVGAELLKPWPLKVVVDQVLLGNDWPLLPDALRGAGNASMLLWVACASVLVLALLSGIGAYFRDLWLADTGQRVIHRVRKSVLERLLEMSVAWHGRWKRGDLLLRLCGDAQSLRLLLVEGVFSLTKESLLVVGTLVVMALLDWKLALVALAVLPLIGLMTAIMGIRLRRAARKQRLKEGELATSVHETLSAVPVIQAYGLEEHARREFARQNRRSNKAGLQATRIEGRLGIGTEVAMAVGTAITLLLGVERVRAGALTPGELLVVLSYVRAFYRPIRKGLNRSAAMVKAAAAGERVLELLDVEPDLPLPAQPVRPEVIRGGVELRNVTFSHDERRPVLAGADLRIEAGEHVALVGENGAGKTSLAMLLPRLRDVQAGSVCIDGHDVRELDLAVLRRSIAIVFQETLLFDASLRENLLASAPEASEERLMEAARLAGVLDVASRLPDGMDTQVGERGAQLSGGERQRVAIARALLRDAAIVILDEPSSGLDAGSEKRLCGSVLDALRGRTVLLITHDPVLAASAHRVVTLRSGRITTEDHSVAEVVL